VERAAHFFGGLPLAALWGGFFRVALGMNFRINFDVHFNFYFNLELKFNFDILIFFLFLKLQF
jgi:hypothetical protein